MKTKNILWITLIVLLLTTTIATNIVISADKPTLYVDPGLITQPSGEFTIEIKVADVTSAKSLYGWEVSLVYNPGLLETSRTNVRRGPFLRAAVVPQGYTTGYAESVDNFLGVVNILEYVYPKIPPDDPYPPVGATGDGTLATITFHIIGPGVSPLGFDNSELFTVVSSNPVEIDHQVVDGVFDSRPSNADPVALFVTKTFVTQGELLTIDGSWSTDDGWIVSYEWDFDYDGMTFDVDATGEVVFHTYDSLGTHTAALRVTDNDGASNIASKDIEVVTWMEGGTFPELVQWYAKPEKPKWYEETDGQLASLNARIGNPTSESYEVYAEFVIHSKDEAKKLGTIVSEPQTITGGEILTATAFLDLTDNTWACFSGSPEWVSYGYYGAGGMRKYWVYAKCYYDNGTGYQPAIVVKDFHFNVLPAYHDIGVDMWTATETIEPGGILEIYANITNKGPLSETFVVNATYKGEFAQGMIEQREVTVAGETTVTETFSWDTTGLPLGPYIIKVTLPLSTYEYPRDTGDQEDLAIVRIE